MMIYFMPRIGSYHSEMGADLQKKAIAVARAIFCNS